MPDAVEAFLAEHPLVETIELLLPDLAGIPRGKRLNVRELAAALAGDTAFTSTLYAFDTTGTNVDDSGLVWEEGDADRPLALDPETIRAVPWRPDRAQIIGGLNDHDGTAFFGDSRRQVRALSDRLAGLGLHAVMALEFEFYLLDPQPDAWGRPRIPSSARLGRRPREAEVYLHDCLDEHDRFFDLLDSYCAAQQVPAKSAIAEYAPAQFEVNLGHVADPVRACDDALMFKRCVKAAAREAGYAATFMAKPFEEFSGSGLHLHVSLIDGDGRNVFADPAGGDERLRHAVWGLQQVMAQSMLLSAPNANSYRRFRPGSYAPGSPCWGYNNRTVALRVPSGPDHARRVEHRVAGADANPYLVAASLLAGLLHGLEQGGDPGPPITGNAYEQVPASLPLTWESAIASSERPGILQGYLDPRLLRLNVACRKAEMHRFNARIPPLDYEWYMATV